MKARDGRRSELRSVYFQIYMTYNNSHVTLEELGDKYHVSKQRVWQIVRLCKIGDGNYFRGLEKLNEVKESISNAKIKEIKCSKRPEHFHSLNRKTTFKIIDKK